MEFLFELIFEIIIEGSLELGTSRRVPLLIRILAMLVFLIIYGGLLVLFGYGAITSWKRGDFILSFFMIVLTIVLLLLTIFGIRKKYKEKNSKDNGMS